MKKVSVECRNVSLSYGSTEVLKSINISIEPGEFFALLGPSGSGKSTLLRLIAGFNTHNQGELLVDGIDISRIPPWQRDIGMVFQSYALWPHMTVWDNVAFGLVERNVPRRQIEERVHAALQLVDLSEYGKRYPGQLSGGQQQRVALARTVIIEPKVLLLDEPLSNLDKNLRIQMRQELLALQRRLGITTIFVTHDQEEAMTTADRMAVLNEGIVQQIGTPSDLYDKPVNRFVGEFVGSMNRLEATVSSLDARQLTLRLANGRPVVVPMDTVTLPVRSALKPGSIVSLCIRPHQLYLHSLSDPATTDQVSCIALRGTVTSKEFMGQQTRYFVSTEMQRVLIDQPHHPTQAHFAVGAAVTLELPTSNLRILDR